jgi:FkbM family methyltransferase
MIPMGSTVLDIGANIGNHTIFYAKFTWAKRVYAFEPNPKARTFLEENVSQNSDFRSQIDLTHVRFGIGKEEGRFQILNSSPNNLGGTRLTPTTQEESIDVVECRRLDSLSFEGHISFLKIDVEGMEIDVLLGAVGIISKYRPVIAVEISTENEDSFWKWTDLNRYQVTSMFWDYVGCKTYVIIPK